MPILLLALGNDRHLDLYPIWVHAILRNAGRLQEGAAAVLGEAPSG